MSTFPAVRAAIDLHNLPTRVASERGRPLPDDLQDILRIVAGDEDVIANAATETDRAPEEVVAASKFFVEQILMAPDSDSYRILGAAPDADANELRQNMALLMRWLHPDTGSSNLRAVFASRVTEAWDTLKTPDRRTAYDRTLADAMPAGKGDGREHALSRSKSNGHMMRGSRSMPRNPHTFHGPGRPLPHGPPPGLLSRMFGWLRR